MDLISPWLIYFIMQADVFVSSLATIFIVLVPVAFVFLGTITIVGKEKAEKTEKQLKIVAIILFSVWLIGSITPKTNTLIAMFGIPAAIELTEKAVQSETSQKIIKLLNSKLDEYLEEK